ncbi:hypothetical protein D3C75_763530 [compost metagenome]
MLVKEFICLRAQGMNCWTFTRVEHPQLNKSLVDVTAHLSAKRIDFTDYMSFGRTADRRITWHECHHIQVNSNHQSIAAHPGRSKSSLAAGMSGAYDHYVIAASFIAHL